MGKLERTAGVKRKQSLVWKLAKNDFRTRYAGSYMGILWALVQPVVTVLLYYFVFEVIFDQRAQRLAGGIETPYVLWLTAGLVPWFYFSEALQQGANAFTEYSYLVKKVVFDIKILPAVKVLGALFVHAFFVCVLLLMCLFYGITPELSMIQIPYYSFCLFALVLAITYTFSSVMVFFRDLAQIIAIGLQVGMWATPILWDISFLDGKSELLKFIFKLNPVYYIVNGYRGALFGKRWFFRDWKLSLYFWGFTVLVALFGRLIYTRLKPHFSDVL
ncbi:MAG: ABC transporter permease [Lachnospiraceae bacterium]|nr:ABC transporter permease [Lachnospiraceae bacterium]